jgi:hypothetical protein
LPVLEDLGIGRKIEEAPLVQREFQEKESGAVLFYK